MTQEQQDYELEKEAKLNKRFEAIEARLDAIDKNQQATEQLAPKPEEPSAPAAPDAPTE